MSSIDDDLDRRLENWARWYHSGGGSGVSSIYGHAGRSSRGVGPPPPIINGEAIETDTAYRALPHELQVVLRARYLRLVAVGGKVGGELYAVRTLSEVQVAAALYVSYDTYLRHLQRARAALAEQIWLARQARRKARA